MLSLIILNSITGSISNGINNFLLPSAINSATSWFSSLHITGVGMVLGALILLFAGKKMMSGLLNIIVILLLLFGIASILGINILTYL